MKFTIKMIMDGDFPGTPDTDTFEVTAEIWDMIKNILLKEENGTKWVNKYA